MHKPFSEQLAELIAEYGMFAGNPDAVSEEIIAGLKQAVAIQETEYAADKAERLEAKRA